jgi:nucleotide-binding universal stress UspA family protein
MRLTGDGVWGEPRDAEECRRVLRRAVELGVNLIDTADAYGPELPEIAVSETIVRVARERDCCAVLVGEHAHGRLGEAFLGVVSRDLIRFARCPVIVIRQGASPPASRAPLVIARSER